MIFKKAAELEKFFEKDIIEFLDKKLALKGAQTEIKDLEDAIGKKDYEEASRIIEEAVENFNHTDVKDVYREVYFNKLLELIKVAHTHVDNLTEKNKLIEDLELLENSGDLNQDATNNINIFEERKLKEIREEEEQIREDREKARRLESESIEINKKLFESIRKRDVQNAILNYRRLKEKFAEYPDSLKEEKTEFFNDLIAFYMRIKKIRTELLEQQGETTEHQPISINKEDRDIAREINDRVSEINKELFVSLRKEDLKSASLNYKELKKNYDAYPNSLRGEKEEFYNDVMSFYNKINKLKEKISKQKPKQKPETKQDVYDKKLKLDEVKKYVGETKKYTEAKNFTEAKIEALKFKHRISMIPEKYINIKNILNNIADQLIQKIEFAKKVH